MDPTIWGPPLWRIMSDVAFKADRMPLEQKNWARLFFHALVFLLPCIYCRQSFRDYMISWPPEKYSSMLEWVHMIHNQVNKKLQKPASSHLSYTYFVRRMNAATHASSADEVFDFCFVLGMNYDPEDKHKRKYMGLLHAILPQVIPYQVLREILDRKPLTSASLTSAEVYLTWLYEKRIQYSKRLRLPAPPPLSQLLLRYSNVKAKAEPRICGTLWDDSQTWHRK